MVNLSRLHTHHDRYGFHKVLGCASLVHFLYRYTVFFIYSDMGWNNVTDTHPLWIVSAPALHLTLSLSSFIFHILTKRDHSRPIIWRQLQLHNIIFTFRSCLCFLLGYLYKLDYLTLKELYVVCAISVCLCHIVADIITKTYGDDNEIGTTIRDMPWPNWVPLKIQHASNLYNALCQVGAICALLFSGVNLMSTAFIIIFPIQLSTLLMTLVRKGMIGGIWWHILYGLSLLSTYFVSFNPYILIVYAIFWLLRFKLKWNKYLIWSLIFFTFMYINFYSH